METIGLNPDELVIELPAKGGSTETTTRVENNEAIKPYEVWIIDKNHAGYIAFSQALRQDVTDANFDIYKDIRIALGELYDRHSAGQKLPDIIYLGNYTRQAEIDFEKELEKISQEDPPRIIDISQAGLDQYGKLLHNIRQNLG